MYRIDLHDSVADSVWQLTIHWSHGFRQPMAAAAAVGDAVVAVDDGGDCHLQRSEAREAPKTFGHPYVQDLSREYHRLVAVMIVEHLNKRGFVCHWLEEETLTLSFHLAYLHRCDPAQRCRAGKECSTCCHLHLHPRCFPTWG